VYLLEVIEGPDQGRRFALPEREPQLIGRSTEAIPITDESVSRRHAELTPDGGQWWLRDLASTNGTFLNDQRIDSRTPVIPGDRIRCGDTVLAMVHEHEHGRDDAVRASDPTLATVELIDSIDPSTPRFTALATIVRAASRGSDEDVPLEAIAQAAAEALEADRAAIVRLNRDLTAEGKQVARGPDGSTPDVPVDLPRELLRDIAERKQPRQVRLRREGVEIIAAAGIIEHGQMLGVLALQRDSDTLFTNQQLAMLETAGHVVGMAMAAIDAEREAARAKRLAAMGEAIAALSHSIKNILQGLRGGADAVELGINRGDLTMASAGWPILARNLDRILALTLNMLAFAKDKALDIEPTHLGTLARDAVELLSAKVARQRIEVTVAVDPDEPPISIDPDGIHQALVNVLDNAIDAAPEGTGHVELRTRYDPTTDRASIEISDDGDGIAMASHDQVFEPFVSSKGQRGTGLGLAVARKLIQQHGGTIAIVNERLGGTTIRIELPASREDETDAAGTRGPRPLPGGDLGVEFSAE
jgi:signal transduction histidine kinase